MSKGLVKAIGISNFSITKTERLLQTAKIVPAVNQVEYHPFLQQEKLKKYCNDKGKSVFVTPKCIEINGFIYAGILLECYSPLGNPKNPYLYGKEPPLMKDPVIATIAKKHSATPAQVRIYILSTYNIGYQAVSCC